jgi:hypothetical protein
MDNRIRDFDWKNLSGKTLKIIAVESPEGSIVIAKDVDSYDDVYVIEEKLVTKGECDCYEKQGYLCLNCGKK